MPQDAEAPHPTAPPVDAVQVNVTLDVERPWAALISLLVGLSIIIIDGTMVNVLLPDMVTELGLTQTDAQWVNSIYSLVFAALLITVGLLADRYGRRLLFLLGVVVFMGASLGSATAQSPSTLIAFRALQAAGASMVLPSSIAVINVLFTGKNRSMAFGLWGRCSVARPPSDLYSEDSSHRISPGGGHSSSTFRLG